MSRRRGTQHLKRAKNERVTMVVRGVELREVRSGDAIRCGTVVMNGPDGLQFVFADYRLNAEFRNASGIQGDGCEHVGSY